MRALKILVLVVLGLLALPSSAAHITGGELKYEWLGGTTYRITMRIYKECGSDAPLDNPASFTLFRKVSGSFFQVVDDFYPNLEAQQIVPIPNDNECLVIDPNICFEEGLYEFNIDLPSNNETYVLTHQRCCRNSIIQNLQDAGNQGTTLTLEIPPTNIYRNSSPVFEDAPPLFICTGRDFIFPGGAIDIDGDSLVYEMCTPFTSGTNPPAPERMQPPPYTQVTWNFPLSESNQLGGEPLRIQQNTGVLQGKPNNAGSYTIAYCVKEYRDGVLLSTTIRDILIIVTNCTFPEASVEQEDPYVDSVLGVIGFYEINCNDSTVFFENTSAGAVGFRWDFGVEGINSDTSNQSSVSYVYPDTGTYVVTHTVTGDNGCVDSTKTFVLVYPGFEPDFEVADGGCTDSIFQFTDLTVAPFDIVESWDWDFGDDIQSSLRNPEHKYAVAGNYPVSMIVETNKGCTDTLRDTLEVFLSPNADFTNSFLCDNTPINLVDLSSGTVPVTEWLWKFGDGQTSAEQNPVKIYSFADEYAVQLDIVDQNGCTDSVVKFLDVPDLPLLSVKDDTIICPGTSAQLFAQGTGNPRYRWSPAFGLDDQELQAPTSTLPNTPFTYTVEVTDTNGCKEVGQIDIAFFERPALDPGLDTSVCLNPSPFVFRDSVRLTAEVEDNPSFIEFRWFPNNGLSSDTTQSVLAKPESNQVYNIEITDTNSCISLDSVKVVVLDPTLDLVVANDTFLCLGDTIRIQAADQGSTGYSWNTQTGLSDSTLREPLFYPESTFEFILQVSNYCYQKFDSINMEVIALPPGDVGSIDSVCFGEAHNLLATGGDLYQWRFDQSLSATNIPNPVATPTETTTYFVSITDTSSGCSILDTATILVYFPTNGSIELLNGGIPFACANTTHALKANGGISYRWVRGQNLENTVGEIVNVTPAFTNRYVVEITNVHGCESETDYLLNVQEPVQLVGEKDYVVCDTGFVNLMFSGAQYYNWRPFTNLSDPNVPNPVAFVNEDVTYQLTASNDCFDTVVAVNIIQQNSPSVDAGPEAFVARGGTVELTASGAKDFVWFPNDGLFDQESRTVLASPEETITYYVIGTDELGCEGTDSVLVNVLPENILRVPTAFSPNNDGRNDRFGVVFSVNVAALRSLKVYTKDGSAVFSTEHIDDYWDGTYEGEELPIGVYIWNITYRTAEDQVINQQGTVLLVR